MGSSTPQIEPANGNGLQIQELQEFWLKCLESLRRYDLAIETARRDAEEQVPKRQAEALALYTADLDRDILVQNDQCGRVLLDHSGRQTSGGNVWSARNREVNDGDRRRVVERSKLASKKR